MSFISKPYGLVLAGGGGKGAYQIGAWKAMRELGITFEAIAGVSIGSVNGALIACGNYKKAEELWNSISVKKGVKIAQELPDPENLFSKKNWGVLLREIRKNRGFDASPLRDFLSNYIDENRLRKSRIPLGLITVQMTQGITPLELFTDDIPEGQLLDYIMASCDIPLANNIGPEGERFLDGGAYDNVPISFLKRNGYNRLIVVDISSIKGINHNLDFLNCEIVYIRPYNIDELGASFDFDDELIAKRFKLGYLDTKKAFSLLLGKIYYFEPDTFRGLVKKYGAKTVQQLEEIAYELEVPLCKIYTEVSFLTELKIRFDEKREEERNSMDEEEKDKNRRSFLRFIYRRKNIADYADAIAILDNIII